MKKRIASIVLCVLLLIPLLSFSASADTGPKPSVTINIKGLEGKTYYATLLSKEKCTGPWGVDEHYQDYYGNEEIWQTFREYDDADGFYFINCFGDCTGTDSFVWSYYPPEEFKVLVYLPETETFYASGIYETFAFHTAYSINLANANLRTDIPLSKSMHYSQEIFTFACRAVLCLAAEILIAVFFGLTAKKQLKIIFWTNLVTQILLNAALFGVWIQEGPWAMVLWFVLLEIAVFVIEGIIYALTLKKHAKDPEKKTLPWLYSLTANAFSLALGFVVAKIIPQIF